MCPPIVKAFYLIDTIGEGFHSDNMVGHMQKVDPNESGSLDRFAFVRWYVNLVEGPDGDILEEEVNLESTEEYECAE